MLYKLPGPNRSTNFCSLRRGISLHTRQATLPQAVYFMMRTQNSAFNTGNRLTERSRLVFTRRATDNQHIDTVIMLRCKSTNRQRSHAVPKQNHREVRKMPVYFFIYCPDILKHRLCSAAIHISQIIRILHALSMSAMIMNNCYVPFFPPDIP